MNYFKHYSGEKNGFYKHGMTETRFYRIWGKIRERCLVPKTIGYKDYGGRGIKCIWNSFEDFRKDMHESYIDHVFKFGEKNTSIDRIDVNGNYCKENCRWANAKEQTRNMRTNRVITFNNESRCLSEWAEITGIKVGTLWYRIVIAKMSPEKALTSPLMFNQFN